MPPRLTDRLDAARRQRYAGRRDELDQLTKLLSSGDGSVVFVHGPGGVGKTALLHQLALLGADLGRTVLRLDGRGLPPAPEAVLARLGVNLGELAAVDRALVLVDNVESLIPLARWASDEVLPRLAGDTVIVLAGRHPPGTRWRQDPGWWELLHTIRLDNLCPPDARELLRLQGVPEPAHAEAIAFTHGNPLALMLVADCYARSGAWPDPAGTPELVSTLLTGLIGTLPSPAHRATVEVAGEVRAVTEPLLTAMLEADARDLFDWLCRQPFADFGPDGVHLHDLVREVVSAELRWRHPQWYAQIHRVAGAHCQRRLESPDPVVRQTALTDYAYLHRRHTLAALAPDCPSITGYRVQAAAAADWPAMRTQLSTHEGPDSVDSAGRWFAEQPEAFHVVRGPDGTLTGWFCLLRVDGPVPDPAVSAALSYLDGHAPLRPGEFAYLLRFWLERDEYQSLNATQLCIGLHLTQLYLTTPRLAVTLHAFADPEFWAQTTAYFDMHRWYAADFEADGHTYGVYGHDWRTTPPGDWLALLAEREVATMPLAVCAAPGAMCAKLFDASTFAAAVRDALRCWHAPDRLRQSPLLAARLVAGSPGTSLEARLASLRRLVDETAALIDASAKGRRAFRALHHTYLRPAETQQQAADLLNLPMSTYRRHLTSGINRLTELLWQRELAAGQPT